MQRKRGRPSKQQKEIATLVATQTMVQRPDAPYDLTDEETNEWWAIVNRMPAEWFPRETHAVLAQYCRHVVSSRRISQLIQQFLKKKADFNLEDYDKLLKMQEREGRAISSLATRMRITHQSVYRHDSTAHDHRGESGIEWEIQDS